MVTIEQAQAAVNKVEGKRHTKSGFWEHMDDVMAVLYQLYPIEMIALEETARYRRDIALNDYGADKSLNARELGTIPPRFNQILIKLYNRETPYSDNKELWRAFFRRYRQFSYAKKI